MHTRGSPEETVLKLHLILEQETLNQYKYTAQTPMPSKLNHEKNFNPKTPLTDLGLPHVDVVLTERFLLPPEALKKIGEPVPTNLEELSEMSGMPLKDVWAIICECLELDQDLRQPMTDLSAETKKESTILLDMRPGVTIETEPLHPDARLFHAQNPQTFLPFLRTLKRVLVISHSDAHAWSAAMSLKKMGIPAFLPDRSPNT